VPEQDDEADTKQSPPSYEEATQPTSSRFSNFSQRHIDSNAGPSKIQVGKSFLQYFLPDPKHVKCRCGAYVDTTKRSPHFPAERVRCMCGYIVSSNGYACHPSHCKDLPPDDPKCGCGELLPDTGRHQATITCKCGAEFGSDGSVKRFCPYHRITANDARNVQCQCGRYVDTTAIWRILHGTKSLTIGELNSHPRAGYSHYDYTLPERQGRCFCGLTVMRDGTCSVGEHWQCCTVLSCKPREDKAGSEQSCKCA
jgi:hypothetical protein